MIKYILLPTALLHLAAAQAQTSDGYPPPGALDGLSLRNLVREQKFVEAEQKISEIQTQFEKNYRYEELALRSQSACATSEPAFEPIVQKWIASSPQSPSALMCASAYF